MSNGLCVSMGAKNNKITRINVWALLAWGCGYSAPRRQEVRYPKTRVSEIYGQRKKNQIFAHLTHQKSWHSMPIFGYFLPATCIDEGCSVGLIEHPFKKAPIIHRNVYL